MTILLKNKDKIDRASNNVSTTHAARLPVRSRKALQQQNARTTLHREIMYIIITNLDSAYRPGMASHTVTYPCWRERVSSPLAIC